MGVPQWDPIHHASEPQNLVLLMHDVGSFSGRSGASVAPYLSCNLERYLHGAIAYNMERLPQESVSLGKVWDARSWAPARHDCRVFARAGLQHKLQQRQLLSIDLPG